jgi:AraC-like DNA-binding protein
MREVRCRRAAALISNGSYIKEAADALGFASSSHLCHEFKKGFFGDYSG